ncbi:MAG: tRNA guanosine(34) transglycosylase Tgt [Bacillota bacterium]
MTVLDHHVEFTRGQARLGSLRTPHGAVETPVFMPVGTQATVKSCLPEDIWETGTRILLSNAYHLYLRPGLDVLRAAGGLHKFMNWDGAILTDSGGFQVMSLGHMVSITDEAATFRSHIDGRLVTFCPEDSIEAQIVMGSDIVMCLDQCSPYPVSLDEASQAVRRTLLWAKRALAVEMPKTQALFGIVQGSTYNSLRRYCAMELAAMDFSGYALGGLAVGEPKDEFYDTLAYTMSFLPEHKPRYLMGVGHPLDLVEGALAGVDMFDCVLPTRNARHGRAFTMHGSVNLKNAQFRAEQAPIEEGCDCRACRGFSRSYIRHLFASGESLAQTLVSIHNIRFFQRFMAALREAIRLGSQWSFREEVRRVYPIEAKGTRG